MIETTARNATLQDLATLLADQHARKVDIVAPALAVTARDGRIVVKGAEQEITLDGVTTTDGTYVPTAVFDEGLAAKLEIPAPYLRRLREQRTDLYDANVNGWLHGRKAKVAWTPTPSNSNEVTVLRKAVPADPRKFMLRCFRGDDGVGVGRAFLSDSYRIIDNLDVLTAALDGVREAGVDVDVDSADLTDRRMSVRLVAPAVQALAPVLLNGYRNPFGDPDVEAARNHGWNLDAARAAAQAEGLGYGDGGEPVVFAGLVISNSETGNGAFTITPRMVVRVCKNGLTITRDAMRGVHLGAKQDEGLIRWSDDTQQKNLALIQARTRDAVTTFLDTDYMTRVLGEIEEQAGVKIADPTDTIKVVGKRLNYSAEQQAGILDHFIRGGQMTAGGVLAAVTSYAQTIADGDTAGDIEASALRALDLAATAG